MSDKPHLDGSQNEEAHIALSKLRKNILTILGQVDVDTSLKTASSEELLKYINGVLKTLHSIESMVSQMREQGDNGSKQRIDMVEFRRQLEIQIEGLVESDSSSNISGKSKP